MLHLGRAGSDLHELDKRYITGYTSTADMSYWVLNCLHSKVCLMRQCLPSAWDLWSAAKGPLCHRAKIIVGLQ